MNIFHQAFGASTPADRLILTFVSILLFAVSWQTVAHIMHKLSVAKRKRDLFYAMAEGVELKVTAHPTVGEEFGNTGRWCRDVQQWVHHTGTMLGKYSAQAAISFRYSPDPVETSPSGGAETCAHYETLVLRLNSLRSIIEHPDVYM
jgi:hypothetical protein